MKKKIVLIAVMCAMLLGLAACSSTDPTAVDYNGRSYEDLKNECQMTVQRLASLSEEEKSYYRDNADELTVNLINRWDAASAEGGTFSGFGDFKITKSGKTLTAAQIIQMSERQLILTYVYTAYNMELKDITVESIYTLEEKMQTAVMNMFMGMGIVFGVLIIICLMIFCFKIFPYLEKKKAGQASGEKAAVSQAEAHVEQPAAFDDGELIAVIAAAVAAAEGTSTDGFIVRSIRRR